jgi:adenylate cyclase
MKRLKRNGILIAGIVTISVILCLYLGYFNRLEDQSLDLRFKQRKIQHSKAPIVIAEIDDESLEALGKWPWPRKIHARLIDVFSQAQAKAVATDILFYEPDRYHPDNDVLLARAIKKNDQVVSAFDFQFIEEQVLFENEEGELEMKIVPDVIPTRPIEEIVGSSNRLGFVNAWPDEDGYLRRGYLSFNLKGELFHSFNLQAVSLIEQQDQEVFLAKVPSILTQKWGYPTHQILVNWRGPQESFESHSCKELLDPAIPMEWKQNWLKGKIVIVGSTALGLYDHYPTPFSPSLPGLYYHANIMDNLLTQEILVPKTGWLTIIFIILLGLLSGILALIPNAWTGASIATVLGGLFWMIAYLLFSKALIYIEVVAPIGAIFSNYLAVFFYRFIIEQKEKAGIKKAFGVYVNPHVVEQIAKNPEGLKLGGEIREMTVLFSDVEGFTSISENLSPKELVSLLNIYLTAMTENIMKYDGTVDKYEGDAIMAFWGAPLVQLKHAEQACLAALENRERLVALNKELEKKGMKKLLARCGINTGQMNVGNMGSSQKFNYTVMGDAVNLASRLEGANKQYGTYLMISESTYEQAKKQIEVRELDLLRVKGKNIPIRVFELLARAGELQDAQKKGLDFFHQGLELYRKRQFKKALNRFEETRQWLPADPPSQTYIQRIQYYQAHPPPHDWDGVYVMTTK